ncbi:trypsin-like serine protease [Corynebacterium sp. 335C]
MMANPRRTTTVRTTTVRTTAAAATAVAALFSGAGVAAAAPVDGGGFPPAPAGSRVVVGPGDPIRMPSETSPVDERGAHLDTAICSSSVPGTVVDENGVEHHVQFTAGHCVGLDPAAGGYVDGTGTVIYAPTTHGDERIGVIGPNAFPDPTKGLVDPNDPDAAAEVEPGEMTDVIIGLPDAALNGSDWAFVELDDDVAGTSVSASRAEDGWVGGPGVPMTGVVDYGELAPGEISLDNMGKRVCIDGTRTSRQCGYQVFRVRNGVWAVGLWMDHGDSGGNAYDPDTNQVIGANSMRFGPFNRFQPMDVALEEAYGIPDGQVNERFTVDGAVARDGDRRTIDEDLPETRKWREESGTMPPASPGSRVVSPVQKAVTERVDAVPELRNTGVRQTADDVANAATISGDLAISTAATAAESVPGGADAVNGVVDRLEGASEGLAGVIFPEGAQG